MASNAYIRVQVNVSEQTRRFDQLKTGVSGMYMEYLYSMTSLRVATLLDKYNINKWGYLSITIGQ